jgi:hypothetical protein
MSERRHVAVSALLVGCAITASQCVIRTPGLELALEVVPPHAQVELDGVSLELLACPESEVSALGFEFGVAHAHESSGDPRLELVSWNLQREPALRFSLRPRTYCDLRVSTKGATMRTESGRELVAALPREVVLRISHADGTPARLHALACDDPRVELRIPELDESTLEGLDDDVAAIRAITRLLGDSRATLSGCD